MCQFPDCRCFSTPDCLPTAIITCGFRTRDRLLKGHLVPICSIVPHVMHLEYHHHFAPSFGPTAHISSVISGPTSAIISAILKFFHEVFLSISAPKILGKTGSRIPRLFSNHVKKGNLSLLSGLFKMSVFLLRHRIILPFC